MIIMSCSGFVQGPTHPRARRSQLFDKRSAGRVGTPLDKAAQAVAIDPSGKITA